MVLFQAINVIKDLQENKGDGKFSRDTEPFCSWWRGVASTSLAKLETMQRNPGQPVRFAGLGRPNLMEAFIDPENKLNFTDKLSQVGTRFIYHWLIAKRSYLFLSILGHILATDMWSRTKVRDHK